MKIKHVTQVLASIVWLSLVLMLAVPGVLPASIQAHYIWIGDAGDFGASCTPGLPISVVDGLDSRDEDTGGGSTAVLAICNGAGNAYDALLREDHEDAADAHREHASLEESAEIDSDIVTHTGDAEAHHTLTCAGDATGTFPNCENTAMRGGAVTVDAAAPDDSLVINSAGDVGLGAAATTSTIDVFKTASASLRLRSDDDALVYLRSNDDSVATGNSGIYFQDGSTSKFLLRKTTANDLQLYDYVRGGTVLTLYDGGNLALMQSGGKVGVGTTAPSAGVHVTANSGSFQLALSAVTYGLRFIERTGYALEFVDDTLTGSWQRGVLTAKELQFNINGGTQAMFIDTAADIAISGSITMNASETVDTVDVSAHAASASSHHAAFSPSANPATDHSSYVAGHADGADCSTAQAAQGVDANGSATGSCIAVAVRGGEAIGDNDLLRGNTTTGVQGSGITVDDSENLTGVGSVTAGSGSKATFDNFQFLNDPGTSATYDACMNGSYNMFRCTVSTLRFKTSLEPLSAPLRRLLDLKAYTYVYDDGTSGASPMTGLIAEEVARVIPNAAKYGEDGLVLDYDTRAVVATLVGAVQTLQAHNEQLVAVLEVHKAFIETLSKRVDWLENKKKGKRPSSEPPSAYELLRRTLEAEGPG